MKDIAKAIRELSRVYFNKKKEVSRFQKVGCVPEHRERIILEMRWLSNTVRDLVEVGDQIKTENGWTTIESVQRGRISPVGLCCEDGHLYEGQAVLEINK